MFISKNLSRDVYTDFSSIKINWLYSKPIFNLLTFFMQESAT